jgi:LEA14-like dessication related protein
MQKKHWLIFGLLILIISIVTIFVVISLTGISTPTVLVKIDAVQLTEDNVSLNISMQLDNQNSYSLVLKDMTLEAKTAQNTVIGILSFPKKSVPAHESVIVQSQGLFGFNHESLDEFESHISGEFGVNIFGFSLSLPLNITVITNPTPVVETIVLPTISLDADIMSANETGILLNGSIKVDNQNEFSMSLQNTDITIDHSETKIYSNIIVNDTIIRPKSKSTIGFSAFIGYEILDIGNISAEIAGDVTITVAGISLTRPFIASAQMKIPDLASFLMDDDRIVVALLADFDVSLAGLNMNVGFRFYNPTMVPLTASDLDIFVYRIDNDTRSIIAQDTLEKCPLPAKNETCLHTTFKLPLASFLPIIGDGIPDWFLLTIKGDFIIANSNQRIPVQLNGYLSGIFFGTNTVYVDMLS